MKVEREHMGRLREIVEAASSKPPCDHRRDIEDLCDDCKPASDAQVWLLFNAQRLFPALLDVYEAAKPFTWIRPYQAEDNEVVTITVTGAQMKSLSAAVAAVDRLAGEDTDNE